MFSCVMYTDTELTDGKAECDRQMLALSDSLTMSLVVGVDATCMILRQLSQQLRSAVCKLQFLVPESVYLPAPPVYCPQPAITVEVR